jgi:hypothetical protein
MSAEMVDTNKSNRGHRIEERGVREISTAHETIGLLGGQYFCRTAGAWEIWQDDPTPHCIRRIPMSRVLWVSPKPGLQPQRDIHPDKE